MLVFKQLFTFFKAIVPYENNHSSGYIFGKKKGSYQGLVKLCPEEYVVPHIAIVDPDVDLAKLIFIRH
jgi:hypothetical protein